MQVKEHYGCDLSTVGCGGRVGVLVDGENCLHVHIDGHDQGVAARDVPQPCYALFDVYGQCTQVSVEPTSCLLYTSDAADDGRSVDLGGRRIIKKIFFFRTLEVFLVSASSFLS